MRAVEPESVGVIVSTDYVGDGLMKLPLARGLRRAFPGARISWITTRGPTVYAGVLAGAVAGCIDGFVEMPELADRRVLDLLRPARFERRFDLLLDTRGRWKQAATARRVPHRWFLSPAAHFLFSDRRPRTRSPHVIERLLTLVEACIGQTLPRDTRVVPGEAARALAGELVGDLEAGVGIAPGAGHPKKIWPLDSFVRFARRQLELARQPVFVLGPAEQPIEATLREAVPEARFPLQSERYAGRGGAGVEDTIAIGERMVASLTNDSGAGHMLAASGRAQLSLFGPTRASKLGPLSSEVSTLQARDLGGGRLMSNLTVEAVEEAFEAVFARGASG